ITFCSFPDASLVELSLRVSTSFLFSDCRIGDNANTRRQSSLSTLVLALFDFDINVVGISPFLFKGASLLPKAARIKAFAVAEMLGQISVHAGANFFDFGLGRMQ